MIKPTKQIGYTLLRCNILQGSFKRFRRNQQCMDTLGNGQNMFLYHSLGNSARVGAVLLILPL